MRGRPVAMGVGMWGSRQVHLASDRSVGKVGLMHARVALPTLDHPFLDGFWKGYSPKSTFEILRIRRPTVPKTPDNPVPWPISSTHILWCRIAMRSLT